MASRDPQTMLAEAQARSRRLLEDLLRQQAEIEANPADLPATKLAEGRCALQRAIDAARRMIDALNAAAANSRDQGESKSENQP
ncbi:MAG: hypothetical protein NZ561_12430 [Phycisphaerae bacterium]|nr:hypothetical protein [Phycisphaerae bacterium]MDW8261234.1 hypothetical protein [Phycisphaerales bacterium]